MQILNFKTNKLLTNISNDVQALIPENFEATL